MFRPSMSAGLNGWGEGGTFDCQEEGVDGQAPAGPACHGMATWIKCWRMSWTPFSCGGRKYELETPWLWYFRAKLVSPYFDFSSWRGSHWCWNVFVKIHSDPFGPQHINCLRCLAPSWHISAVAPAGSEGCCPVPGALLHRGALDFSPFRVTTSSCNGGWSERFRCLWSARITFGISFYFLPFVSAQVNSGKMDIKKKSQVTVFSFVPSIPASQGWYHLMSRKSFASSSRSTASPRRQVKLPTVGRAGKVCGKVFSGIDWCLNTEHLNFFWVRQVWPAKVGS